VSDGPLAGYRVLVTRPTQHAGELTAAIEAAGGTALSFPVMQITGRDPAVVAREFGTLPRTDVAIFVSRNAADYGLSAVRDNGASIAAVGPATRAAIEAQGVRVDIYSNDGFDSEHLLEHPALKGIRDKTVTIVRGESGRELLTNMLTERGASVSILSAYRREMHYAQPDEVAALDEAWRNGGVDCTTVMSVETLKNLLRQLPSSTLEKLRITPLVAPGDRVIQTAMELVPGIPAVAAAGPRVADILNALIETRHSGSK
jgi:uroporphyrinogen-III synthase